MPDETTDRQKYFADQFDDEEVLYVFHKHPIVMRKGLVFGAFGPLIGVLPTAVKPTLGIDFFFGGLLVGLILGLIIFFPYWLGWHFSVFIITDQRFIQITQKGFFHRSVADLSLAQIQSVNYSVAGIQETILGFGTITMKTYVGELEIKDIPHPAKVQKKILSILREEGDDPSESSDVEALNNEKEEEIQEL
jgi:signal transduction histidine kinase